MSHSGGGSRQCLLHMHLVLFFWCNECEVTFDTPDSLKRHKEVHVNEGQAWENGCNECKEEFDSLDSLKEHTEAHFSQKQFGCNKCEEPFNTPDDLKRHNEVHVNKGQASEIDVMHVKNNLTPLTVLKDTKRFM